MGNKVPWNDDGAIMCFNPAKTWYFNWYSNNHKELNPFNTPFNDNIVGIDDTAKGRAGSQKVLVKIKGDSDE